MKFDGYLAVYQIVKEEEEKEDEGDTDSRTLPRVTEGEKLRLETIRPDQHFTEPPPRYTEATLVKELEEKGIGRPSTYAAIISTIVEREYVNKEQGRFTPTLLGEKVSELLVKAFEDIFDVGFTARMEDELDEIEEGKLPWRKSVKEFWDRFEVDLEKAGDDGVLQGRHSHGREVREVRPGRTPRAHQPPRIFPRLLALSRLRLHPRSCRARPRRCRERSRHASIATIAARKWSSSAGASARSWPAPDIRIAKRRGGWRAEREKRGSPMCRSTKNAPPTAANCCAAPDASAISSAARNIRSANTRARSRSASNARSATKANSFAAAPPRAKDAAASSTAAAAIPIAISPRRYEPLPEPCPKCGAPFIVEKRTKQGNFRSCIRENCDWEIVAPEAPPAQAPVSPQASATFVHPQEPGAEPVGAGVREKP